MYISSPDSFPELWICIPKTYLTSLLWCLIDIWKSTFPEIRSQSIPHPQLSQWMATLSLQFLRPNLEVILDFLPSYSPPPVQQEIVLALAAGVRNPNTLYYFHCCRGLSHSHLCVHHWNSVLTCLPPFTLVPWSHFSTEEPSWSF